MPPEPFFPGSSVRVAADERGNEAAQHTVHVRFAHTQGRRLRTSGTDAATERPLWVERPLLLERADGSYDLIGTTAHLDRLARWVLSHGTAARVQAPDRLRRRVAAEAQRVLQKYGST